MANAIPKESEEDIRKFKEQEKWGRKKVDKKSKREKELKGSLNHVFKPHELTRLVERSGFEVRSGGSHHNVYYDGNFVTIIPHRASGQQDLEKVYTNQIIRLLLKCLRGR